jgi:hypothetical protein
VNTIIVLLLDEIQDCLCNNCWCPVISGHQRDAIGGCQLPVDALVVLDAFSHLINCLLKSVVNALLNRRNFDVQHYPIDRQFLSVVGHFRTNVWPLFKRVNEGNIVDLLRRYASPEL